MNDPQLWMHNINVKGLLQGFYSVVKRRPVHRVEMGQGESRIIYRTRCTVLD